MRLKPLEVCEGFENNLNGMKTVFSGNLTTDLEGLLQPHNTSPKGGTAWPINACGG
jgi:hypothetical protein